MSTATVLRTIDGLRRAWPHRAGGLSVELVDGEGRLRAARVQADGGLSPVPFAEDPGLPALRPQLAGRLVVHRLHRRAVLLGRDRVVKLLRPGHAPAAVGAHRSLAPLLRAAGLGTARVLASTGARVDTALLPGHSLHGLGGAGEAGWGALAEAWPRFVGAACALPAHTGRDEAAVLGRWFTATRDRGLLPEPCALEREVAVVCRLLADGGGPLVPAHRDLHDGQLLWDGAELSLIDLDTACRAEAALDLGNLQAHVELAGLQGLLGAPELDRVLGLLGALGEELPTSPRRIAVHRQAARLRLACVHAYRPSAWPWLPAWVDHCLAGAIPPCTATSTST